MHKSVISLLPFMLYSPLLTEPGYVPTDVQESTDYYIDDCFSSEYILPRR